ncbi:MAG TPA: chemotaxis protein CheW [Methylovirgula sp.]|jgi:purine-binding chemotaxis protein CheW
MIDYSFPALPDTIEEPNLRFESEEHCFIVYVGGESFGLPVIRVQTIFQMETVTPVPLGPPEVLGLVNLRGKIVTAVSLRHRLQMPEAEGSKPRLAIGIEHRGENFALVIDEVGDVIVLDPERRIPMPPHLETRRAKLTDAVYRLDNQILSLLDMNAVFDFQRRN